MIRIVLAHSLVFILLSWGDPYRASAQDTTCHCSISGFVRDQDDRAISGEVRIYRIDIQDGRARPSPACSAKTGSDGEYVCALRSPGQYIVEAHPLTHPAQTDGLDVQDVYPVTYYPNVTNIDSASRVSLSEGAAGWANVTFTPSPSGTIQIILPAKPPRSSLTISLHGSEFDLPSAFDANYDAATGTFTVKSVPAETYKFNAGWFADDKDHRATAIITTGIDPTTIVRMQESISVRIDGQVTVGSWPQPVLPTSISLEDIENIVPTILTSKIDRDGHFVFPSVPEAEYRLRVPDAKDIYVKSASLKGAELPQQRIVVVSGESYGPLTVDLSGQAASISGTVTDVDAAQGKTDIVVQSVEDGQLQTISTDQVQRFFVGGLKPGEYRLFAWSSLKDVEYRNAAYLAQYSDHCTTMVLHEGEHVPQVEVQLLEKLN